MRGKSSENFYFTSCHHILMKYYKSRSMRAASRERYWDKLKRQSERVKMKKDHKSWEAKTLYLCSKHIVRQGCSGVRCLLGLSLLLLISQRVYNNTMSGSKKRRASDGYRQSAVTWGEKMFVGGNERKEEQRKTTNTRAAAEQQGTKRTWKCCTWMNKSFNKLFSLSPKFSIMKLRPTSQGIVAWLV